MARPLSPAAMRSIMAQYSDEVWAILLTIEHPNLAEPIRVTSNSENIVSNGETYIAFPFGAALPSERDDQMARVQLIIDNVDRRVVEAVRTITSAPTVTMSVVLASDPDTIEAGPWEMTMRDIRYDALTVQGELSFENILNAPCPEGIFSPADFPGLY